MADTHGGNIFKFAHEHHIEPHEVIDFSANINPLGPSPKGLQSMQDRLPYISHYPDITNDDVLNAVADIYGMPKDSILLGNGAAELLYAIGRLPQYTGAFVPAPGFSEYASSMNAASIPVRNIFYREREAQDGTPYFEIPYLALQTFAAELKGQNGRIIVFLGNPNNPDGTLVDRDAIAELATMLEAANSLLVIDESFIDFIGTDALRDNAYSMRRLIETHPNILVVHSFTKFYAVPGLRIGAIFGNPTLISTLSNYIPAWSVNTLAQAYIIGALNDVEYIKSSKQIIRDEQQYLYNALCELKGLQVFKPSANYILMNITDSQITVNEVQDELAKHNMVIRNCAHYDGLGPTWMRIAIKTHDVNEKLVQQLSTIFNTRK